MESLLAFTETFQRIVDLRLQPLEVFQGHVKEVAGAASRIEDFDGAKMAAKVREQRDGFVGLAGAVEREGGGLYIAPVLAERLDDGGDDQALHVGARGVVRTQGVALTLVQRPFEQGSEDGGFHILPLGRGSEAEKVELVAVERQGLDGFE